MTQAVPQKVPQAPAQLKRLTRTPPGRGKFDIPPGMVPPGMSYEWKRLTNLGMEDKTHQLAMRRNHWTPVPAGRHPEMYGEGQGPVIIDGLMLMERPAYLTEEARLEDAQNAIGQLNNQMARLDQIPGVGKDFEQTAPRVQRAYERTEVPDDEPAKPAA